MKNIGTAKMPTKVAVCPFCRQKPEIKPYPNNTGASVRCKTLECATWGQVYDLEEWNKRAKLPLHKYLFDVETFYVGAEFHKTTHFVCKECKAKSTEWQKIKHSKDCNIGKYYNDTP